MQHKKLQVRVERHACPTMRDGARAHAREPSSRQRFATVNSIVAAAHRLPAEVAPPPRVWRSLRLQLQKEGIFSACMKESLPGHVRTSAFKNRKEQRGVAAMREEGLRQGEAKFRALVESIASAIFISRGNRLRYVNHAAEIMNSCR
jgi:PAS domain-containing protein